MLNLVLVSHGVLRETDLQSGVPVGTYVLTTNGTQGVERIACCTETH